MLLSASHSTRVSTPASRINGPGCHVDVWVGFFGRLICAFRSVMENQLRLRLKTLASRKLLNLFLFISNKDKMTQHTR